MNTTDYHNLQNLLETHAARLIEHERLEADRIVVEECLTGALLVAAELRVGDSFVINTPSLSTKGVVTRINRKTVVYDAPYMVCPGVPDGWLRGLRISLADMADATIFRSEATQPDHHGPDEVHVDQEAPRHDSEDHEGGRG